MKRNRRGLSALLAAVMLLALLSAQALAAGRIDPEQEPRLCISYQDGSTPLAGAQFAIYLVATVDAYGELTPTDSFAQFPVEIRGENDDAWNALAMTLESYVLRDQVAPTDSGRTDRQGLLQFPNQQSSLQQGLYLVLGQHLAQNGRIYTTAPFLLLLPSLDQQANVWVYDVTAHPKHSSDPVPVEPQTVTRKVLKIWQDAGQEDKRPEEITVQLLCDGRVYDTVTLNAGNRWQHTWTGLDANHHWTVVEGQLKDYTVALSREGITFVLTNTYAGANQPPVDPTQPPVDPTKPSTDPGRPGSSLPQTGQLWWPVPVLIAAGLLLLLLGALRRRGAGHEKS